MQRYDISWRQGGVCNATGPVHVTMHMADDEGPAAFVIDALQLTTDVKHAETFDKAESGYFELQDGRQFRVIVEQIPTGEQKEPKP